MSLYWQQAVQNRGSAPAAQHNVHSAGDPQADQWQNVNYQQTNYWSQETIPQNYLQSNVQQTVATNPPYNNSHHQYPPQAVPAQPPQVIAQNQQPYSQSQDTNCYGYQVATEQQHYNTAYHPDLSMAPLPPEQHLPQVSSLSSIPEFETLDFPTTTTTPVQLCPEVAEQVHQSVQSHPQVATEQITEKPSSQVTPESTYSVDTFNSTYSKEEKKEDLWDDWVQTPRETVHESSSYAAASTHSAPTQSGVSRESTISLEYQQNGYSDDLHTPEHQPVAQVAPLLKHPADIDQQQPIARVGPVYQVPIEQNVRRVAPTRPMQAAAIPILENNFEVRPIHTGNNPLPASEPEVASLAASTSQEVQPSHYLVAPELEEPRVTPNNEHLQNESIGEAQATSTPNESVVTAERERFQPERRSSVSSIRSGMQPISVHATNGDQSDSTQGSVAFSRGGTRASYQERYKGVKEKYLDSRAAVNQVMRRLDQSRIDTPKLVRGNPLGEISGRRSAIQVSSSRDKRADSTTLSYPHANISNYSQPDPSLNESIDISTNGAGYGEEFVDASRRSRLNRSRPPSRARSDIGEDIPYQRQHAHQQGRYLDNRGYPTHPQYFGYYGMGRHSGRVSATGVPYPTDYYQQQAIMNQRPRPQSTYDSRAMERYQRTGNLNYDAYASRQEEDESASDEESESDDEAGESEDEMRNYNMQRGVNHSFSSFTMGNQPRQPLNHFGQNEYYYFGIIRLDVERVKTIFRKLHVPQAFEQLDSKQKAAYLYYAALHNKLYPSGVVSFQDHFSREYYTHKCNGSSVDEALIKICESMYNQYLSRRQNNQQRAYEASQRQLFSDDRDSADGSESPVFIRPKSAPFLLSDRASVYDRDDDRASDILSIDQRAPLKHRSPHAFMNFGRGGKMIILNPEYSPYSVVVEDVRASLKDNHSRRLIDAAQNFKGPLLTESVPSHSVLLYIQSQISRVNMSEVAKENPNSCDVVDCLLLWKLLEMIVKQHGRVTGPDIAGILASAGNSTSRKANHREKSNTPSLETVKTVSSDSKAYELFTYFLLGGHVDEAVKHAVSNGLHADAMILVRRIFPGDEKKLADIESRFLTIRPSTNPVMTLAAVASGQLAPVLTNPPNDDAGSWRSHAAIVLANLHTDHAKHTVYRLGCVLAKREYHAAADFCFLAVSLLSNFRYNVFQKPDVIGNDSEEVPYVSLIHASLPDDEWDSTNCRYGFSLTDLHATEIFDYAIKLSAPEGFISPLQLSVDFQRKRLQYAQLLANLGGFQAEAFKYLLSVAGSIWKYYDRFTISELTTLEDLANSLQLFSEPNADNSWIAHLQQMIDNLKQSTVGQQAQVQSKEESLEPQIKQEEMPVQLQREIEPNNHVAANTSWQNTSQEEFIRANSEITRSRTNSLEVKAHDWHADRQEPIQMSPRGSTSNHGRRDSIASVRRDSIITTGVEEPMFQSIPENVTNQQQSYGEQLFQTQNAYYQPSEYSNESSMTTSPEASPARQRQPLVTSTEEKPYQPVYESPPRPQQQFVPQQSLSSPQPSKPPALPQAPASQPSTNELKKSNTGSTGFFGSLANKVRKAIPGSNDMRLPDDKNPQIRWDPDLQKWVGDGMEEAQASPPPSMAAQALPTNGSTSSSGGLRAARGGGGSRYVNTNSNSNSGPSPDMSGQLLPPSLPMTFNFIPSMPDDSDYVNPFSVADPTVHGAEQQQGQ